MPQRVEISRRTIVFTVLFILGLGFLYYIQDIVVQLFIAFLIMTILNPVVNFFVKFKIPRTLAVAVSYLLIIGLIVLLISNIAPALIEQSGNFVSGLPHYIERLGLDPEVGDAFAQDFLGQIGVLPAHFAQFALSTFGNVFEVVSILILAFYMLVTRDKLAEQIAVFFGADKKGKIEEIINKIETRLGGWARGQLLLMLVVGVSTYTGLKLLGVPFALPLAIIAGLLEVVPFVGPIIAAIPAVIIGFGISDAIGLATVALAFVIQQFESYVFVPAVMQRSVGLTALMILLALGIGFRLFGILGAVVSIPAVLFIIVLVQELDLYPYSRKSA